MGTGNFIEVVSKPQFRFEGPQEADHQVLYEDIKPFLNMKGGVKL